MAQPTPTTPRNNPSHSTLHNFHVNVKMYGAVGDGIADDTTAVTNAIAAAYAAKAPVFFPPTTSSYKVTSTINLNSYAGTWLLGGGAQGNTGGGAESGVVIGAASSVSPVFSFTAGGTANLTFENLRFYAPGCAVQISDAANVWFKNCEFTATDTAGANNCGVLLENSFWVWFEKCHFYAPSATEPAVILRGKEPSVNVDHCFLIRFKDCRFWYNGVLYKDQNDVAVDAAHVERLSFESVETENFAGTSALIEFQKTASTNWGGRVIKYFSMRNIAFYDYTGSPAAVRLNTNHNASIIGGFFENVLAPRLIERASGGGGVNQTFVSGWTGGCPLVDGAGAALGTNIVSAGDVALNVWGDSSIGFPGKLNLYSSGTVASSLYAVSGNRLVTDSQLLATDGLRGKYLSGAGKTTVVDGDFTFAPGDGTTAIHYDTTGGKGYVSIRANGAWKVVTPGGTAAPTYSTSITPNAAAGNWQTITVTNATAFTINAPTNPPAAGYSQDLAIEILNSSGGVMGAITWNAAFVNVGGVFTNPANTKKRFIAYTWNGASWIETSRASADY